MIKEELKITYLKHKKFLVKLNNALLLVGLLLMAIGIGASYQAGVDVHALNESLYNIAITSGILTDGKTYYYVGLYENRYNFSSMELINRSQCQDLYGEK